MAKKIYIQLLKKMGWLYRKLRSGYLFFLDIFSRNHGVSARINDFSIKLPGLYSRYFPKDYEKENFYFLKNACKPGMVGIDIGGHLGLYSIRMAQLGVAKVFCFEPTPNTYNQLEKMIRLNHFEDIITIRKEAIGENTGKSVFYLNTPANSQNRMSVSEANSLKFIDHGKGISKEKYEVNVLSIDDFVFNNGLHVNFVKIDVEGSELEVLRGAVNTIKRDKPFGILSVHCFTYDRREQGLDQLWGLSEQLEIKLLFKNKPIRKKDLLSLAKEDIFDLQFIPAHLA